MASLEDIRIPSRVSSHNVLDLRDLYDAVCAKDEPLNAEDTKAVFEFFEETCGEQFEEGEVFKYRLPARNVEPYKVGQMETMLLFFCSMYGLKPECVGGDSVRGRRAS